MPRILVLYNEPVLPADHPDAGSEHDILDTVHDAFNILVAAGFDAVKLGVNTDPQPLLNEIKRFKPDAVFNLFEGVPTIADSEVAVAALLEWLGMPFTGCPSASLGLGRDKVRVKHLLAASGLPTAEYAIVEELPAPTWNHEWPAIVKPATQDASVGIDQKSVVTSQAELDERVKAVLEKYGPPVLIERFISGREFHVNMIEEPGKPGVPFVLPIAEIAFEPTPGRWSVYTFTAKWDENSDEYRTSPLKAPVFLPDDDFARLKQIAERCYRLLRCRDYARIDVRMDVNGRFYVLEMNPNPYLNSLALVNAVMHLGGTHEKLITEIALAAVARNPNPVSTSNIKVPVGVVTAI